MDILSLYCTFYSNILEPQIKEIPHSSRNPSILTAVLLKKHATLDTVIPSETLFAITTLLHSQCAQLGTFHCLNY